MMRYFLLFMVLLPLHAFDMTSEEKEEFAEEGYVIRASEEEKSGAIVFDVPQNVDEVYAKIIDLASYPTILDDVDKVVIHHEDENHTDATLYISTWIKDFHNKVLHTKDKAHHTFSWHLDQNYSENYFAKMQGSWQLEALDSNRTRIWYTNKLEFKGWIPGFLKSYLLNKGLKASTFWLREEES